MTEIGYTLSSEEHGPQALVEHAVRAEQVGFSFAGISDHFHPWIDKQGESPFVWGVLGAISQATERLQLLTGVTCPTTRIHPGIIAQAAATAAALLPGRFSLGVGSGENLTQHILGDRWPAVADRQARLEEAIEVIRLLWSGGLQSHRGTHYTVENARIYSLPDELRGGKANLRPAPHLLGKERGGATEPRWSGGPMPPSAAVTSSSCRCRHTSKRRRSWSGRRMSPRASFAAPIPNAISGNMNWGGVMLDRASRPVVRSM